MLEALACRNESRSKMPLVRVRVRPVAPAPQLVGVVEVVEVMTLVVVVVVLQPPFSLLFVCLLAFVAMARRRRLLLLLLLLRAASALASQRSLSVDLKTMVAGPFALEFCWRTGECRA